MIFKIFAAGVLLLISLAVYGQSVERKTFVPPLETSESGYFYIPFDVPANTKSLTIAYSFDEKKGLNSLDLGVFDSRFEASETLLNGFRGSTGRRRNTTSHRREIDRLATKVKSLLVLRGAEATTYGEHFSVWDLPSGELIDFRITPKDAAKLQKPVAAAHRLGLTASINHPALTCGGGDWSYGDWRRLDAVEIWNGVWSETNEKAVKLWDEQLQKGLKIPVIGSSGTYNPPLGNPPPASGRPLGQPTTHAGMKSLSQKELLAAIKNGRVWISDEADDYRLSFAARNGETILNTGDEAQLSGKTIRLDFKAGNFPAGSVISLISNGETVFKENTAGDEYGFNKEFSIEKDSYFRLEIRNPAGEMPALTNPIYFKTKR